MLLSLQAALKLLVEPSLKGFLLYARKTDGSVLTGADKAFVTLELAGETRNDFVTPPAPGSTAKYYVL